MAELRDRAGIFTGDVAEAFAEMEYAVMRDPGRLAHAQAEMTVAMERVIASRPTTSPKPDRRGGHHRARAQEENRNV